MLLIRASVGRFLITGSKRRFVGMGSARSSSRVCFPFKLKLSFFYFLFFKSIIIVHFYNRLEFVYGQ